MDFKSFKSFLFARLIAIAINGESNFEKPDGLPEFLKVIEQE